MRILIIEDELYLAESLEQLLKKENYTVDVCHDGETGFDYALSEVHDLILLDIMLPKKDGLTLLKEMREASLNTPVILLTARSEIDDKVLGLDCGADDYLAKPFNTAELLARIRANLRRKADSTFILNLSYGDLVLEPSKLHLYRKTEFIKLTRKEAELLEYLMLNENNVISKEQIIEKVWGYDSDADDNHVEVYISFLRKKIAHLNSGVSIETIRGSGYLLKGGNNV